MNKRVSARVDVEHSERCRW